MFSCLVWILDDATKSKLKKKNFEVRKYLTELLTLDLYYLNKDYANDYTFIRNKEGLIALNLYSVAKNRKTDAEFLLSDYYFEMFGNVQDFVHTFIQCLAAKFIENFQFIKSENYPIDSLIRNDLPLIRIKEIEYFNVIKK